MEDRESQAEVFKRNAISRSNPSGRNQMEMGICLLRKPMGISRRKGKGDTKLYYLNPE
jgi:hypothetical protein